MQQVQGSNLSSEIAKITKLLDQEQGVDKVEAYLKQLEKENPAVVGQFNLGPMLQQINSLQAGSDEWSNQLHALRDTMVTMAKGTKNT